MSHARNNRKFVWVLYAFNIFFTLHLATPVYTNSSLLNSLFSTPTVSALYILAALLTIGVFLGIVKLLSQTSNTTLTSLSLIFELFAVASIVIFSHPFIVSIALLFHLIFSTVLSFHFDIFLEHYSPEEETGRIRGIYLTCANAAWIVAPALAGLLTQGTDYTFVYLASLFLLIPVAYLFLKIPPIKERPPISPFRTSLRALFKNKNKRGVLFVQLLLRIFFAWMVVYMPLHLSQLGFSAQEIGFMFALMLSAYVFLEYPIGQIADTRLGEKEIMTGGFVVIFLTTLIIPLIGSSSFALWTLILFGTRVGAAMVEITSESYFFKQIKGSDVGDISIFRLTQPLSYLIAPLIATPLIALSGFSLIFAFSAGIMLLGIPLSLSLNDTR